ncbi:MAG: hypothetical protein AAGI01_10280, partial [Myxococcota bacterium]
QGRLGGTNAQQYPQGVSGGCFVENGSSFEPDARENFYKISLGAGDTVRVDLESGNTGELLLYLQESCDLSSCVTGTTEDDDLPQSLTYHATSAIDLLVVVDSDSVDSTPFTLGWQIIPGLACAPGQTRCIDSSSVGICSRNGLVETVEACDSGCTYKGCNVVAASADVCSMAQDAGRELAVFGNFRDLSDDINLKSNSCVQNDDTPAGDAFYTMTVQPGEALVASAVGLGRENPAVYLLEDCAAPDATCVRGIEGTFSTKYTGELTWRNETGLAVPLTIGVDGTSSSNDEPFLLQARVVAPECTSDDSFCTSNGTTLRACNPDGFFEDYECTGTCTGASCDNPSGDVCVDPLVLSARAGFINGVLNGTDSQQYQSGTTGQCTITNSSQAPSDGKEKFYQIALAAGETIEVEVASNSDHYVFIQRNCSIDSCVASTNNEVRRSNVSYRATNAETVRIVVDSDSTVSSSYTLEWSTSTSSVCAPGTSRCVNATTAAICNATGRGEAQYACAVGCSAGACELDSSTANRCATAVDVGSGYAAFGSFANLTPSVNLSTSSCVGDDTPGPDAFYRIAVAPGEVLTARLDSLNGESLALYAFEDCAAAQSSCLVGAEASSSEDYSGSIQWVNDTASTKSVLVGVDSQSTAHNDPFYFYVSSGPTECTPSVNQVCAPDGVTLRSCGPDGNFVNYLCNGSCAGNKCDNPSGNICSDALELTGMSGTEVGTFGLPSLAYASGRQGQCYLDVASTNFDDQEKYFIVDLAAGDTLYVDAQGRNNSGNASSIFASIQTSCAVEDCQEATPQATTFARLSYYAAAPESVLVVLDASRPNTVEYTLNWRVSKGNACAPGGSRCVDGTTVGVCNQDGSVESQFTCATACDAGACVVRAATADSCSTAVDVGAGYAGIFNFRDTNFSNSVNLSRTSCVGGVTGARDVFYKITLQPGEILDAKAESYGGEATAVYIFESCATPDSSCLVGARNSIVSGFYLAETQYLNDTGSAKTVFVGFDGTAIGHDEPVKVTLSKTSPNCTPGEALSCAPDGITLRACSSVGLFETYACDGACTAGACENPAGDVCVDAVPLLGLAGALTDRLDGIDSQRYQGGASGQCVLTSASSTPTDG